MNISQEKKDSLNAVIKINIDPADYAPLAPLGIPALTRVDASSGLRGDKGVTNDPVTYKIDDFAATALATTPPPNQPPRTVATL